MHSHHRHLHRRAFSPRHVGLHARGFSGRHGRRGERIFDQGDLRYVILKLIDDAPRHGYEIIKAIEEMVGGAYSPSPGVIYPTLTLLEELGYIAVEAREGGKKLCRITSAGETELAERAATVEGIFERMADLHRRFQGPSPRISRAVQNLMGAIRLRMRAGELSSAQLDQLVDAIDEAARKVEKA